MTSEGRFVGHSHLGWDMIRERIEKIPTFPDEKRLKLWDMIVHHHGSYNSSADTPASNLHSIEAVALHYADDADAKVGGFAGHLERAAETKEDWVYIKELNYTIYTR
jgi:3'-5' exoribonuclease